LPPIAALGEYVAYRAFALTAAIVLFARLLIAMDGDGGAA
jgi:hypothetical protein